MTRSIAGATVFLALLLAGCASGGIPESQPSSTPSVSPPDSAHVTFAVEADPHMDDRSDADVYRSTLQQINASRPAFLVDLGDDFMIDKLPEKSDTAIQARFELMRAFYDELDPSIPLYMAMGNHDGETGWDTLNTHDIRARYFPDQTHDLNYFSWEQGDALMIVLDPYSYTSRKPDADGWGWTLGKTQYDWLTSTLETSTAPHRYVLIHQLVGGNDQGRGGVEWAPYFEWGGSNSDGSNGFAENRPGWAAPIAQVLADNGVDIVFKGHDHFYAHQEAGGLTYQTLPQPSHPGDKLNADPEKFGYTSGTILGGSGFVTVTTSNEGTRVTFISSDGRTLDEYDVANK